MENTINKQFISFKLYAILCSVLKSHAALFHLAWMLPVHDAGVLRVSVLSERQCVASDSPGVSPVGDSC